MKLEDLTPKPSKIYLSHTGKEYTLRPWTLQDQIWMKQNYGNQIEEMFKIENIDFTVIARMLFRLIADKTDFKEVEFKDIDENGKEIIFKMGGYQLFIHMIKEPKEQRDLLACLFECIGLSQPALQEINNIEEKKSKASKSTGPK